MEPTEGDDRPRQAPPPREPQSYSEKYAGTIYGSSPGAPAAPPPAPEAAPASRFGFLGITLILAGLWWLIPGIIGLASDLVLAGGGGIGGVRVSGAAIGVSIVAQIVSILIGVKILLAPGRFSLGCTGISALLVAVGLLAALSQVPDPTTTALAIIGVGVGLCVVFALAVLTASQVV
jgi:hypothetical protein